MTGSALFVMREIARKAIIVLHAAVKEWNGPLRRWTIIGNARFAVQRIVGKVFIALCAVEQKRKRPRWERWPMPSQRTGGAAQTAVTLMAPKICFAATAVKCV